MSSVYALWTCFHCPPIWNCYIKPGIHLSASPSWGDLSSPWFTCAQRVSWWELKECPFHQTEFICSHWAQMSSGSVEAHFDGPKAPGLGRAASRTCFPRLVIGNFKKFDSLSVFLYFLKILFYGLTTEFVDVAYRRSHAHLIQVAKMKIFRKAFL